MIIITLKYVKPLAVIDSLLTGHRQWLDEGYRQSKFICSGPQNPRTGGVIIADVAGVEEAELLVQKDPFYINGAAEYGFIEFSPVKYDERFACYIK